LHETAPQPMNAATDKWQRQGAPGDTSFRALGCPVSGRISLRLACPSVKQ